MPMWSPTPVAAQSLSSLGLHLCFLHFYHFFLFIASTATMKDGTHFYTQ